MQELFASHRYKPYLCATKTNVCKNKWNRNKGSLTI